MSTFFFLLLVAVIKANCITGLFQVMSELKGQTPGSTALGLIGHHTLDSHTASFITND